MKSKFPIDENVFCRMVRFYSKNFQLSPLAARIYAYLMFDFEKVGVTFEELVEDLAASKSSVSTNLQYLVSHKFVNDLPKLVERKRYFVVNYDYFKIRFQEIQKMISEELLLIEDLEELRKNKTEIQSAKFELYKSLLEANIQNFNEALEKL